MLPVIIIAVVVAFVISGFVGKTGAAAAANTSAISKVGAGAGNPSINYLTPPGKTANTPSATPSPTTPIIYGTGPKPGGIVTGNNRATGSVSFYCTNATEARGLDISGAVLFDVAVSDGANSAVYFAGAILDHIDFMSVGGVTRVQTYYPTQDTAPPSATLIEETFNPVGQTAATDSSQLPYPAGDPNYNLPKPSPSGAYDPSNSWLTGDSSLGV